MSSNYGLICLNHDPGIEFGDRDTCYEPAPMIEIARNPSKTDWAAPHTNCDLVVARYSCPIVELACPGRTDNSGTCTWHINPHWVDADWMRLLIAAYRAGDAIPGWVTEPFSMRCWKRQRVLRLGPVLGFATEAQC